MAYEPIRKYGDKDKLPSGDPGKVIYGAELDEEFEAISTEMSDLETTLQEKWEEISGDIPGVGEGDEDGETLTWSSSTERWEKNDLLKVQPSDKEIVLDGFAVSQPALINQDTGQDLGQVQGNHGFVYRSRRFENANDPWTGTTGNTWEVASIEPRDGGNEPARQNGIDLTADRVTLRVTADWTQTDWYETQIVFRAEGEELELGARQNTSSVFTNGDVYVGHRPDNRPDNNDVNDGTLFCKQGVIVGRGNTGGASIGMEGNIIWGLGEPTDDSHAINLKYLKENAIITGLKPGEWNCWGALTVRDYLKVGGNTRMGNQSTDEHIVFGDFYIGYDESAKPDNSDVNPGTLFLERGVIIGRDRPVGTASIGMEGNIIWECGDISFSGKSYTILEYVDAQLDANESVYDELIKHSLQIEALQNRPLEALEASSTFEEFKQKMIPILAEMIAESEKSKFERPER